jgi:hypothetical protein
MKPGAWLLLLILLVPALAWAQADPCDDADPNVYFASPSGLSSNSGTTPTAPIRIQDFWTRTTPLAGKTLCLLSGTYLGTRRAGGAERQRDQCRY